MMRIVSLGAALLSGCSLFCPAPPVPVSVPIAVSCVKVPPTRPALISDGELASMADGQLVLALYRDRILSGSYIAELEVVLRGCVVK